MSSPVVSPATPLVVGVQTYLTPPNTVPNVGAVVIQNLSGYLLTVMIAGAQWSLPPYTCDLFQTAGTGSQVTLLPSNPDNSPAGLPAYAIAEWFAPQSVPDPSSYPSSLTAPAYALGVAIAEALFASGVPSVLIEANIFQGNIAGGASRTFDVGNYATLAIGAQRFAGLDLDLEWITAAPVSVVDLEWLYAPAASNGLVMARLAVEASQLQITNNSAGAATINLSGSNRTPLQRVDVRSRSTAGARYSFTGAMAAGSDNIMGAFDPSTYVAGPATATFKNTGTATGRFDLVVRGGRTVTLCDTAEMITNTAGNLYLVRNLMLPEAGWAWQFHAQTAQAAGTASVDLLI